MRPTRSLPPTPMTAQRDDAGASRGGTLAALLLVALAWTLAACPLGDAVPVESAAQARAVGVARAMADGGDLVVPSYRGESRLKKGPLQSWAQAGAMAVSGTRGPEAAAWASFVLGLLWAATPWMLGRALSRPLAGLLGSLALCSTRATTRWGWSPEHDVVFGGFVGLAWAFLARALSPSGRARDSVLAGLATAAALLVRGPFALAFVGVAALVESVRRRDDPGAGRIRWIPFALATLLPAAAWLALVAVRLGGVGAVFDEMRRQALGEGGAHARPFYFFLGVIPAWSLFWTIPALAAAAYRLRAGRPSRPSGSLGFAATIAVVGLLTLTVVPAKQDHYAVPLLPALFLLAGGWFEDVLERTGARGRSVAIAVALAMGAAVAVNRLHGARVTGFVSPSVALVALSALALAVAAAVSPRIAGLSRSLALALVFAAALAGWGSQAERHRGLLAEDLRTVAPEVERLAGTRTVLGFAPGDGEAFDALDAWLARPVARLRDATLVQNWIDAKRPFAIVVAEPNRARLDPYGASLREAGTASPPRAKDAKDRYVVLVRDVP